MNPSRQMLLRSYLFVGGVALIALLLFYTDRLVRKLEREVESASFLFAQFSARSVPALFENDPRERDLYRDVVNQIEFPIILTDREGRPRVWRNVGVALDAVTEHELAAYDASNPPPDGPIAALLARVRELDAERRPIPIRLPDREQAFGHVHYGRAPIIGELRLFPFIELSVIALFIALAVLGYRSIKEGEQRSVWAGMAKETAHQLGTPISSLMGWVELLRERMGEGGGGPPAPIDAAFLADVVREMESDTARLEKTAARFSHIGSLPRLEAQDVLPPVMEAVRYLRRRLPVLASRIEIVERFGDVPPVHINRELIEWVVENLLRNAVDSIGGEAGRIEVAVQREPSTESVEIRVSDDGRGMDAVESRRVFEPGYTTKRRGWGLGLSLARRIVEEYHGGRIHVDRSIPGEGTTFVIRFPV